MKALLVFQVIGGRNSISDTRKIKNKIRSRLDTEQAKGTALKKQIADNAEKWIPRLEKSLTDLKDRIRALHLKNAEKSAKCEKFLKGTYALFFLLCSQITGTAFSSFFSQERRKSPPLMDTFK